MKLASPVVASYTLPVTVPVTGSSTIAQRSPPTSLLTSTLPSGATCAPLSRPVSPGTVKNDGGTVTSAMNRQGGHPAPSIVHVGEQPSPAFVLPSSHSSPSWT